jgi:hypothetical protein
MTPLSWHTDMEHFSDRQSESLMHDSPPSSFGRQMPTSMKTSHRPEMQSDASLQGVPLEPVATHLFW